MANIPKRIPFYPHFAYASDQLKVCALRMKCGPGAYSIYQRLNEFIFRQDGFSCFLNYEALACEIECDVNVLKSIINDFGLFVISEDGKEFTSVEMMEFGNFILKKDKSFFKKKINMPYFNHYRNSFREIGFVFLFAEHGHKGTEVYWLLKEMLCDCKDSIYPYNCKALSHIVKCEESLIHSVICDFGLFELVNDGTAFRCVDLDEQIKEESEKRLAKARARAYTKKAKGESISCDIDVVASGNASNVLSDESGSDLVSKDDSNIWNLNLVEEIDDILADKEWLAEKAQCFKLTVEQLSGYALDLRMRYMAKDNKKGHESKEAARDHFVNCVGYQLKRGNRKFSFNSSAASVETFLQKETKRLQKQEEKWESERLEREEKAKTEKKVNMEYNYISKGYLPFCVPWPNFSPEWREKNPAPYPEWIEKCKTEEGLKEILDFIESLKAA